MYHIKREAWFGGAKLNGVNCRRLMNKNEDIINKIRDMFIEMNKGTVTEENINMYCDEHKQILTEMDNAYRCMRTLTIRDDLITKTKSHICKTMLMWRKLKIPVTPSAHLFEDHIMFQIEKSVGGLADKSEDHIERAHQDGKRSERNIITFTYILFQCKDDNIKITKLLVVICNHKFQYTIVIGKFVQANKNRNIGDSKKNIFGRFHFQLRHVEL